MACVGIPDMQRRIYYIFISSRKVFANKKGERDRGKTHVYVCFNLYYIHTEILRCIYSNTNRNDEYFYKTSGKCTVPMFFLFYLNIL